MLIGIGYHKGCEGQKKSPPVAEIAQSLGCPLGNATPSENSPKQATEEDIPPGTTQDALESQSTHSGSVPDYGESGSGWKLLVSVQSGASDISARRRYPNDLDNRADWRNAFVGRLALIERPRPPTTAKKILTSPAY